MSSSWKRPFEARALKIHKDPRGSLFEFIRFRDHAVPEGGQVYIFSIAPGQRRGDHYHGKKEEWWTCAQGRVTVLVSDDRGAADAFKLSADEPSIAYMAPGTSHAALNEGSETAVIVAYTSTQFNEREPDTYMKTAHENYKKS